MVPLNVTKHRLKKNKILQYHFRCCASPIKKQDGADQPQSVRGCPYQYLFSVLSVANRTYN